MFYCMNKQEKIENYENLAKSLDELAARFMRETGKFISSTSVMELLEWVNEKIES